MLPDSSSFLIWTFVGLFTLVPLGLGWICRWFLGPNRTAIAPLWITAAQTLTAVGWALAFLLGRMGWMSYEASVLMGAMLFVPGQFCLSLFSTRR
jgi:hypothetical protein